MVTNSLYHPPSYPEAMEVLIVGAGAMGRWFAAALDAEIAFADSNQAAAEAAASEVTASRVVPVETDERFELVVLAVPMTDIENAIATHAPNATAALIDLAGVMAGPVAAMTEHAPDRERVSLHPLFAPANAPGRIAVVPASTGPRTDEVRDALRAQGNTLFETTSAEHDRAMQTVQAKTHAAILAFALAADTDVPEQFGTPIYESLDELAREMTSGTPRVYADIQTVFEGAEAVAHAAREIADADRAGFEELYRDAGR